jgi:hypothetical protein
VQAIGRQPQWAPDGASVHYERHRTGETTYYRLVRQHAATFFAQAEDAAGADLPQLFKDEFDAFLECGILAHGFTLSSGALMARMQPVSMPRTLQVVLCREEVSRLIAAAWKAVCARAAVKLRCDHTHHPAHVAIAPETLASLAGDLQLALRDRRACVDPDQLPISSG